MNEFELKYEFLKKEVDNLAKKQFKVFYRQLVLSTIACFVSVFLVLQAPTSFGRLSFTIVSVLLGINIGLSVGGYVALKILIKEWKNG